MQTQIDNNQREKEIAKHENRKEGIDLSRLETEQYQANFDEKIKNWVVNHIRSISHEDQIKNYRALKSMRVKS